MKARLKNLHHRNIRLLPQKKLLLLRKKLPRNPPTKPKIQETALPRPRSQLQQKPLQPPKPSLKLRRPLQPKRQNPRQKPTKNLLPSRALLESRWRNPLLSPPRRPKRTPRRRRRRTPRRAKLVKELIRSRNLNLNLLQN
jgi:hypothetical protein